jgi:hypothetical protein
MFEGFQRKFVMRAGVDAALFTDQEHSLHYELELLARRIDKQMLVRKARTEASSVHIDSSSA